MTVDVKIWLDVQRRAILQTKSRTERQESLQIFYRRLEKSIYPRLLSLGYELPLNVVADLAYIYYEGAGVELEPPKNGPADPKLTLRYCGYLNTEIIEGGSILNAIRQARRALRQRKSEEERFKRLLGGQQYRPQPLRLGETEDDAGLITFLEMICSVLLKSAPLADLLREKPIPDQVYEALSAGKYNDRKYDEASSREESIAYVNDFYKRLLSEKGDREHGRLKEAITHQHNLLLTSSAHVAAGALGLDLTLLETCLNYEPVKLDAEDLERYRHMKRSLSMAQAKQAHSPEFGNYGVTTRGSPSSVLRSYLARPEFVLRVYLNQILYFQRHAPKFEPYCVLLGWIIDEGEQMQERAPTGERKGAMARQLAAYLLEDAVRFFNKVPGLELRVVMMICNGKQEPFRNRIIFPPPAILEQAPTYETQPEGQSRGWIPDVRGFLPYYFLREMVWPPEFGKGDRPNATTRAESDSGYDRALSTFVKRSYQLLADFANPDSAYRCDLCHLTIFGPAEALKPHPETQQRSLALDRIRKLAGQASVNHIAFDETSVAWTQAPRLSSFSPEVRLSYKEFDKKAANPIREAAWRDILMRLRKL